MSSESSPLFDLQRAINSFLDRVDTALNRAVTGEAHLILWTCKDTVLSRIPQGPIRSFIESLRIPASLKSKHRPSFLLEGLRSAYSDPQRQQRYLDIFEPSTHSLVVNVSGSGKTRSVLEGLTQIWGIYFISAREENGLGSADLLRALRNVLPDTPGFTANLSGVSNFVECLEANRLIARLILGEVLLARLLIFRKFIDLMEQHMHSHHIPSSPANIQPFIERWLHLQLNSSMLGPSYQGDIFADLVAEIHAAQPKPEEVHLMVFHVANELFQRIRDRFHGPHGGDAFLVLDEAQDAALLLRTAFRSQVHSLHARPVLREVVVVWSAQLAYPTWENVRSAALPVRLVVTGTGLALEDMREALLTSTVMKDGLCQEYPYMGGFEDRESHLVYIRQYVPQEVLQSIVGKVLLDRMWYWLRGRYRFTAEFLAFLIEHGYKQPNELLSRYIANFTKVAPLDCPDYILEMEQDPNSMLFGPFATRPVASNISLQWEKLVSNRTKTLPKVKNLTWKYMVTSMLDNFMGGLESELIQYGFARIPHTRNHNPDQLPNRNLDKATVDETLVLWACAVHFNNTLSHWQPDDVPASLSESNNLALYQHLSEKFDTEEGGHSWFEDYLAFYFTLAFSNPSQEHTLGDIFHIMGPNATALKRKKARLVSLYVSEEDFGRRPAERYTAVQLDETGQFWSCGGTLGYRTGDNTGARARRWLSHLERAAFCFPDKAMGPDIIFVLELDRSTYIWVMVQAKRCSSSKYLSRKTFRSAIRSVTPWCYFMDKTVRKKFAAGKTRPSDYKETAHKNQIETNQNTLRLLDELPGREKELAGKHSVLRVVASWSAISCQWKHFNKNRPRSEPLQDEGGDAEMQDDEDEDEDEGDVDDDDDDVPLPKQEPEVDPDEDMHPLATLNFKRLRELTESIPPTGHLVSWKTSQIVARQGNKDESAKSRGGRLVNKTGQKPPEAKRRLGGSAGALAKQDIVQKPKPTISNAVRRSARLRKSK